MKSNSFQTDLRKSDPKIKLFFTCKRIVKNCELKPQRGEFQDTQLRITTWELFEHRLRYRWNSQSLTSIEMFRSVAYIPLLFKTQVKFKCRDSQIGWFLLKVNLKCRCFQLFQSKQLFWVIAIDGQIKSNKDLTCVCFELKVQETQFQWVSV